MVTRTSAAQSTSNNYPTFENKQSPEQAISTTAQQSVFTGLGPNSFDSPALAERVIPIQEVLLPPAPQSLTEANATANERAPKLSTYEADLFREHEEAIEAFYKNAPPYYSNSPYAYYPPLEPQPLYVTHGEPKRPLLFTQFMV